MSQKFTYLNEFSTIYFYSEYESKLAIWRHFSADAITYGNEKEHEIFQWTLYVINLLTLSGMPPNQLNVKDVVVVMLLRNLNPSEGLCNGTQLIVKRLMPNLID